MEYIESQFKKVTSFDGMSEPEMVNLLSGNGGSQVDVVLYVVSNSKYLATCNNVPANTTQKSNQWMSNICAACPPSQT